MLIEHRGHTPTVHPSAYIAPTAAVVGDVRIGPDVRVLHHAVLSAEDGQVVVGRSSVVMEHALVRGRAAHPAVVGDYVMIGPHAHVNGATVGDRVFIATGSSIFPGAVIAEDAEIRINAVVQVNTRVPAGMVVPIGWVAVGPDGTALPPERHDDIWAIQRELDFTGTVYGAGPGDGMEQIMRSQSEFYGAHSADRPVEG